MKKYSVLILYPDYRFSGATDTYFAWVTADSPKDAVMKAQRQAMIAEGVEDIFSDPDDYCPLLIVEGHLKDQNPYV